MKKTILSIAFITIFTALHAQNTFPSSGNVGIGTVNPSSYSHGGTNQILEILNPNTGIHSQSHIILSTGATLNAGSIGTISWTAPNTLSAQKMAAFIGCSLESDATNVILSNLSFCTNNAGSLLERMHIASNGNVGIGTATPSALLNISQNIGEVGDYSLQRWDYGAVPTFNLQLKQHISSGLATWGFDISNAGILYPNTLVFNNGSVGIGTTDPQGYKLAVNGNIIAEEVKVKLHANWPDYVFKPTYKLPTLLEVKTYIDQHQHLPEMPSANEVEINGVNLGEIVKLQTKKIEELTLYAIEQQKQIEKLKQHEEARIEALEVALAKLTATGK